MGTGPDTGTRPWVRVPWVRVQVRVHNVKSWIKDSGHNYNNYAPLYLGLTCLSLCLQILNTEKKLSNIVPESKLVKKNIEYDSCKVA